MNDEPTEGIDLRTASTEEITEAMARGVRAALKGHKESGRSVAVWDWEAGCVESIPPDQIELPNECDPRPNGHAHGADQPIVIDPLAHITRPA